jgi:protein-tyrosine phosphatase
MDEKCFGEMNAISQPQNVEQHSSSSIRLEATSSSAPATTSIHSSSSSSSSSQHQQQQPQAASLIQTDKAHHGSTSTTFSTVSTLSSSTSTSEQGGDSSASSSGVATMSSNDHIPCSNINGANNLLTSGSPSSSSNPSPTLVPLHLDTFTKKNSGFGIGFFANRSISQIEKNSSNECNKALEPPGISQRCSSRASSGKNSPLPQLTSPQPASVFSAESAKEMICVPLRTMVSQNRRRFQSDGFNLDLTYITDRIIAMGYPADTAESLYRNNMKHIVKFLEKFHPDKYKVFNLRGQYAYDEKNFHYRVVSYEMKDHHPPRLELMAPFCREVHDHLEKDPTNVVAVHCKAGKGRTGVMICAYLYYIKFFENPRQIMDYYSIVRTHNNKGVTIPSQRRYVYYFSHLRDKQLNYLPLKIELVGIYIERPPKTRALLGKGSINLRVANGDIDVFHGAELSLSSDDYDREDEMWAKYPNMIGEDSYDPYNPQPGKDCISRRCYGWTVPSNARVFLEGDIRVDIVKSPPLSFIARKPDKIGHIWFNTMFTCPSFCGGAYIHGDEAFPYPDDGATIVSKVTKQKSSTTENPMDDIPKSSSVSEHRVHSTSSFSASVPNSPPCHKLNFQLGMPNRASAPDGEPVDSPPAAIPSSTRSGSRTPSIGQHKSSSNGLKLNGMAKKLVVALEPKKAIRHSDRSSAGQDVKCERWSSQDGGIAIKKNDLMDATKPSRASLDCVTDYENNENEAIIVRKPPGLDGHCPEESLQHIYPNGNAPRHNIEEMLRVAYRKNLIKDGYNARRLSVPKEGNLMPKAENSSSRPLVGGPFCLMRKPDEHVSTYPVMEIDRAYKNKEIDCGFKIHIITRCLNTAAPSDVKLAENFINVTRKKQDEKDSKKHETMKGKKYAEEAKRFKGTGTASSESSDQNDDNSSIENSDIKNDPHLKKFFFRQRVTSASKHPNYRYNCSLYKTETLSGNRIAIKTDRPTIEENLNELRNDSIGSNLDTENSSPQSDTTIIPAVHGRSATISTTGEESLKQLEVAPTKPTLRTRSARSATIDKSIKKQSMASNTSDDVHPSDCSWTSSSTSSSCRSLDEAEDNDANSSNSDSATIRRPAESFSDDKRQI